MIRCRIEVARGDGDKTLWAFPPFKPAQTKREISINKHATTASPLRQFTGSPFSFDQRGSKGKKTSL